MKSTLKTHYKFHDNPYCYLCNHRATEEHHIFGGFNRKTSTKYGCVVNLCHDCHSKVHFDGDRSFMNELRQECERWCLDTYKWTIDDFIKIFGRNYL